MAERTGASERPRAAGWRVWLQWMLASTLGWAVGGAALFLGPWMLSGLWTFTAAGLVAGTMGGAVAGALQWLVLRGRLARAGWWIAASTVGWAVGGIMLEAGRAGVAALPGEIPGWFLGGFLGGFGVVGGVVAGFLQWLVLRRQLAQAGWWIVASAGGGVAGRTMLGIGIAVGLVIDKTLGGAIDTLVVGVVAVSGSVDGAVGGAITGAVLVWLLRRRLGDAEGAGSGAARVEAMEV